jgi:O-antigen ligase
MARWLALAALAVALGVAVPRAMASGLELPALPLWPLAALLGLAALQLVPLPAEAHALAPGSRAVWYPAAAEAAAILGGGPHPLSVAPDATRAWFGFATALGGLGVLAAAAGRERSVFVVASLLAAAAGLVVAVYGVVARTLFGPLLYGFIPVPTTTPFGPFVSKNHFAGYVEMASLLALGLAAGLADAESRSPRALSWTESPRAWQVLAGYTAAIAMALSVLVSLSRGGAVSLAAGWTAFLVLRLLLRRRHPSPRAPLFAALAAILLAAAAIGVLPRPARERIGTLQAAGGDEATSFRLKVWRDVLRMASASPLLGHGLGTFEWAFPRYKTANGELRVEHAESDYLELLGEAGLLGLGLVLTTGTLAVRSILAGLRQQQDRLVRGAGLGALAGLLALGVHGLVDFNLRIPSNAMLFTLLLSLALAASTAWRGTGRLGSWAFVLVLLAGVAAAAWPRGPTSLEPGRRDLATAYGIADPEGRRLRLSRASAALTAAVRQRPVSAEGWLLLGWSRALLGEVQGSSLARYGASLDPERVELGREAERLATAGRLSP